MAALGNAGVWEVRVQVEVEPVHAAIDQEDEYPTIRARHRSYELALRELAFEPQPSWFVQGLSGDIAGGREGLARLRQAGPLPTAILCENDWMALGVIMELQQQGLSVPQDISVVGHDDIWFGQQLQPPLTTIHRAEDELVRKAIDLLTEQIAGDSPAAPREVLVDGEMVWRHSAGPAPERLKERQAPLV